MRAFDGQEDVAGALASSRARGGVRRRFMLAAGTKARNGRDQMPSTPSHAQASGLMPRAARPVALLLLLLHGKMVRCDVDVRPANAGDASSSGKRALRRYPRFDDSRHYLALGAARRNTRYAIIVEARGPMRMSPALMGRAAISAAADARSSAILASIGRHFVIPPIVRRGRLRLLPDAAALLQSR